MKDKVFVSMLEFIGLIIAGYVPFKDVAEISRQVEFS